MPDTRKISIYSIRKVRERLLKGQLLKQKVERNRRDKIIEEKSLEGKSSKFNFLNLEKKKS